MTQYVLITGGSSGIGKAASQTLASNGMTVFASAINESEAVAMRAEGIKGIVPVVLDVTDRDSVAAALQVIKQTVGPDGYLHGLVNCAGIDINAPLHVLEESEIMAMINVNYIGGILLTRAVLPLLRHGTSRLVFISSAMALLRTPMISIYCSTKAGIEGFADALRLEMIPVGIKVSVVEPGVIRTPMVIHSLDGLNRMLPRLNADDHRRYEPMMRKIAEMSADPKMASSTEVTSSAIMHALTATKPRIRYRAGKDSKAAAFISNLPFGMQDWIQRKIYGI